MIEQPIPLSLYIHIPWCVRKCPYCDFNSHALRQALPEKEYVAAVLADLEQHMAEIAERPVISIFIGGGTPSLFSPAAIEALLQGVADRLILAKDIEITLEANPGTVEQQRFNGFRAAGINRLSIGVQSFQDKHLQRLGRIYDSTLAQQALEAAKQAGFTNINVDLMFGLPKQTLAEALADLHTAILLQPTHISWYQLTLEPNTLFYHQPPPLPPDDLVADMQQQGQRLLHAHGFTQYEVSAYGQPGKQCRHNRNYWEFGDYVGIGAGAHSKLTVSTTRQIKRVVKVKHPKRYLQGITQGFVESEKMIPSHELPFEFMLNALRLKQAIPMALFEQRTGLNRTIIHETLQAARDKELLVYDHEMLQTTALGWYFLNDVTALFLESAHFSP